MPAELYTTVSGSFRKHLADVIATANALKQLGVHVLSPRQSRSAGGSGDFVYLEADLEWVCEELGRKPTQQEWTDAGMAHVGLAHVAAEA